MQHKSIIGIDMGGTNIRAGLVTDNSLSSVMSRRINAEGTFEDVLGDMFQLTDQIISNKIAAIGIGVPGLVNEEQSAVYDVVNIPSWKEVQLKQLMEDRYHVPVLLNNDANCFALGELYFGKGKGYDSMIGLTIGTGLGSGIIINKKIYSGKNGGAGEFGMIDYLDKHYEYYASGQFFKNVYGLSGEIVFEQAKKGDKNALKRFEELGMHLGNAIRTILYAYDVDLIILGGSVKEAFRYFSGTMWQQIEKYAYKKNLERLTVEVSELENSGILGAAALHYH